ncbi:MAG: hypothetical protein AB8B74_00740, partial [Crocinitomicaceae bacterium]
MTDILKYDFCTVYIHDTYLVVEINEGFHLLSSHNQILVNLADTYFRDTNFVYITHRIHSYSVDPIIYKETSKIKNLAGFAVVGKVPLAAANAQIEKLFIQKPFEIFDDLKAAISWAKSIHDNPTTSEDLV